MRNQSVRIFLSYCRKDEEWKEQLALRLKSLEREGAITAWHDGRIVPGKEWKAEIDAQLRSADLILLLISPDFIGSDYCWDVELTQAMQRHRKGEAQVIPIILRASDWKSLWFGELQALPKNAKPVRSWTDVDAAFQDVIDGVRRAVREIRHRYNSDPVEEADVVLPPGRKRPSVPLSSRENHTMACIAMILLGWLFAGWIGNIVTDSSGVSPQQVIFAGGLGGLFNGLAIGLRLRFVDAAYSRNLVKSIAIWTICNSVWGLIVSQRIGSDFNKINQPDGVLYVVIPGIVTGILFLIWQLKQLRYR